MREGGILMQITGLSGLPGAQPPAKCIYRLTELYGRLGIKKEETNGKT